MRTLIPGGGAQDADPPPSDYTDNYMKPAGQLALGEKAWNMARSKDYNRHKMEQRQGEHDPKTDNHSLFGAIAMYITICYCDLYYFFSPCDGQRFSWLSRTDRVLRTLGSTLYVKTEHGRKAEW